MSDLEKCPRDELLVALDADGLSPAEEAALRAHLETCAACRDALAENRRAGEALRALPQPRPSQAARDRAYAAVLAAMEQPRAEAVESRRRASSRSPLEGQRRADEAKAQLVAAPVTGRSAQRAGFRVLASAVAAAACLFVVAGVFLFQSERAAAPTTAKLQRREKPEGSIQSAPTPPTSPTSPAAPARPSEPAQDMPAAGEGLAQSPRALTPPPTAPSAEVQAETARKERADADDSHALALEKGAADFQKPLDADKQKTAKALAEAPAPPAPAADARFVRARATTEREQLLAKARRIVALDQLDAETLKKAEPGAAAGGAPPAAKRETDGKSAGSAEKKKDDLGAAKPTASSAANEAPTRRAAPSADESKDANAFAGKKPDAGPAAPPVAADLFADPGTPSRKLLVTADDGAFWVPSIASVDSRTPIRAENPVEYELLLRILDQHLSREAKDVEWARKALALERAIETARALRSR